MIPYYIVLKFTRLYISEENQQVNKYEIQISAYPDAGYPDRQ